MQGTRYLIFIKMYISSFFLIMEPWLISLSTMYFIVAPPAIAVAPEGKVAKEGETIVFSCEFDGVPEPTVTWSKDDVVIRDEGRFLVVIEKGYTELEIDQINKNDAGNYMVTLKNSAGTASAWAQLVISGRQSLFNYILTKAGVHLLPFIEEQ